MKKIYFVIITVVLFFGLQVNSHAQDIEVPEGYELVDSLVYRYTATVDTTLVGKDILALMPSKHLGGNADVKVRQSFKIAGSLSAYKEDNKVRELGGYRVRIFFDNNRTARVESENTLKKFVGIYHDVPAYRTYANPYFKVTVGDFRTKSEAMALLERIKVEFPSAFVVRESIGYPVIDKDNAFYVDTVKVLRPKVGNVEL